MTTLNVEQQLVAAQRHVVTAFLTNRHRIDPQGLFTLYRDIDYLIADIFLHPKVPYLETTLISRYLTNTVIVDIYRPPYAAVSLYIDRKIEKDMQLLKKHVETAMKMSTEVSINIRNTGLDMGFVEFIRAGIGQALLVRNYAHRQKREQEHVCLEDRILKLFSEYNGTKLKETFAPMFLDLLSYHQTYEDANGVGETPILDPEHAMNCLRALIYEVLHNHFIYENAHDYPSYIDFGDAEFSELYRDITGKGKFDFPLTITKGAVKGIVRDGIYIIRNKERSAQPERMYILMHAFTGSLYALAVYRGDTPVNAKTTLLWHYSGAVGSILPESPEKTESDKAASEKRRGLKVLPP